MLEMKRNVREGARVPSPVVDDDTKSAILACLKLGDGGSGD